MGFADIAWLIILVGIVVYCWINAYWNGKHSNAYIDELEERVRRLELLVMKEDE